MAVVGCQHYLGYGLFKPGQKLKLVKEIDNDYDSEAIKVELEAVGKVGYVANSTRTVPKGCYSGGRIWGCGYLGGTVCGGGMWGDFRGGGVNLAIWSNLSKTVSCFLQLQGADINEGLVFREFVLLEPLQKHSKSGMPLTKEFRVFFLYCKPLVFFPYWDEGDYDLEKPELHGFLDVAKKVKSNFFTMDIARKKLVHGLLLNWEMGRWRGCLIF